MVRSTIGGDLSYMSSKVHGDKIIIIMYVLRGMNVSSYNYQAGSYEESRYINVRER